MVKVEDPSEKISETEAQAIKMLDLIDSQAPCLLSHTRHTAELLYPLAEISNTSLLAVSGKRRNDGLNWSA